MEDILRLLVAVAVVALAAIAVSRVLGVVTIHDYERGLRYSWGRFRGLLAPGLHLAIRPVMEIRTLDARPTHLILEGQDIPTVDGVVVKISLAARYQVGDPVAVVTGDQAPEWALRLLLQLALRDAIGRRTLDEVLASRPAIGREVLDRGQFEAARVGLELLAVDVRDVMLPAELRRAFAGAVAARKEGEAALERVRAETAALRGMANAARLIDDNPNLLQLRLLQQLAESSGNTVVFNAPDGAPAIGPAGRRVPARPGEPREDRT